MITHDGGMLYRCPDCGAIYVAHDRSYDGWRCDHSGPWPRPGNRAGEVCVSAAYDPARSIFRAVDSADPVLDRMGTVAAYLGVGTGNLEVVIEHWRDGARLPVLQWQPIEPAPFVGAGAGI